MEQTNNSLVSIFSGINSEFSVCRNVFRNLVVKFETFIQGIFKFNFQRIKFRHIPSPADNLSGAAMRVNNNYEEEE
ncbi:MAG: hypothetical protein J6V50_03375 [Clostridia bacterium]|nr:hypothetical protein [Clostridia bacterium]